ncbi:hypothetical protein ACIRJO_02735 [Streptomyces sp. NPDC102394]|uniref:hypothetical protein n=1 Tax=Streptomyces sp. NPDC102394 TaxID=3366167 RepID=UPI003801F253
MARRIKTADVERLLIDLGHEFSEFEAGEWDPGFRAVQGDTRHVFVFWDGPGEAEQLENITEELRAAGYGVVAPQRAGEGPRHLEVTRP